MNKNQLKKLVLENKTITFGDLLDKINKADKTGQCKINPATSREYFAKISESVCREKGLENIVSGSRLNDKWKISLSSDGMIMLNILREFG